MATISIAQIRQLRISIAWQEAVEVVAAAGRLSAADGTPITLEHCLISTEGTVHLSRGTSTRSVAALSSMQLLGALLEGQTAPAELRALAEGAAEGTPAAAAVEGAAGQRQPDLSWFLRPNPEGEIGRLAARALAAEAEETVASEISRLRAGVTEAPPLVAAGPTTSARLRRLARSLVIVVAVIVLMALVGVAGRSLLSGLAAEPWSADGAVSDTVPSSVRTTTDANRPGDPTTAGTAPGALTTGPQGPARPRALGTAAPTPATWAGTAPMREPAPAAAVADGPAPGTTAAGLEASRAPVAQLRLYSATDPDVTPPVLMHPKLPTEPRADSDQSASTIEVTVDESGHVMQARLQSGSDVSLNDRMLVAAAKAWQFRPAIRDGRPVPYVLRVPVTR